jgi:hypothetical protein
MGTVTGYEEDGIGGRYACVFGHGVKGYRSKPVENEARYGMLAG